MKRIAILIGSPLHKGEKGYLRGVSSDIENFRRFLLSSVGGAWKESEIHIIINPGAYRFNNVGMACQDADITLIYFSGHGFMQDGLNYIQLNRKEFLPLRKLYTHSKRQLLFVDSCRVDYPYSDFTGIGDLGYIFNMSNMEYARKVFDYYIFTAPLGRAVSYSSQPGTLSEDGEDGGLYSTTLFSSIIDWHDSDEAPLLTVNGAFQKTYNAMIKYPGDQVPELKGNTMNAFRIPLAINHKVHYNLGRTKQRDFSKILRVF